MYQTVPLPKLECAVVTLQAPRFFDSGFVGVAFDIFDLQYIVGAIERRSSGNTPWALS